MCKNKQSWHLTDGYNTWLQDIGISSGMIVCLGLSCKQESFRLFLVKNQCDDKDRLRKTKKS